MASVRIRVEEREHHVGPDPRPSHCPGGRTVLASADERGRTIGEARAAICGCEGSTDAWIEAVTVEPGWRGAGVARRLVAALLRELERRGAAEVYTLVHRSDVALAPFFREIGFRERPYACLGLALREPGGGRPAR
ncbi:MAG TPA: GNAT family N-acetyltransferase [Candidatus Limnocylindria bacterium]|nr:GNAT family N-acetyltransferase [Candidatus Limnocylindria bacterium]